MNIAIGLPFSSVMENDIREFIVETSFLMIRQHPEHKFIIIGDKGSAENIPSLSNLETILIKPVSSNALLKKLWFGIKLPALLKKINAGLFLTFQNTCSGSVSILQCVFAWDPKKAKKTDLRKAELIFTLSNLVKKKLIIGNGIPGDKITVVYPSANKIFKPISGEERETIKNKYSDSKEFFLFNCFFSRKDDLLAFLKSFSHFKKRQQSNFKLLLSTPTNPFFEESLAGYKYRSDVKFIDANEKKELPLITAAAYAVVLPFNTSDHIQAALNAMRSEVPVIAVKGSDVAEVAKDAALYAESDTIKDIGEKMIQVYTDESHRSRLIEKGKAISEAYTNEKAAEILWQSILKLLK